MILCKYLDTEGCLDVLRNRRLLATDPATFNDPFEFWPGLTGTPDKNKTLRHAYNDVLPRYSARKGALPEDTAVNRVVENLGPALRQELENGIRRASQTLRIICFSDPGKITDGDDIILWAHYGTRHKGVRVHFETDEIRIYSTNLFEVEYSRDRASVDVTDPSRIADETARAYGTVIRTKNKSWEYEQEVRWIVSLEECRQEDGGSYIPLLPQAIRRIDFGCKCNSDDIMATLARDAYTHVALYNAEVHQHKFSLNYVGKMK